MTPLLPHFRAIWGVYQTGAGSPVTFGDYAIWFARKSYEHMSQQPALADAEIAPGARATMRW